MHWVDRENSQRVRNFECCEELVVIKKLVEIEKWLPVARNALTTLLLLIIWSSQLPTTFRWSISPNHHP